MGILEKIKNTFAKENPQAEKEASYDKIVEDSRREHALANASFWEIKLNTISTYTGNVSKWSDKDKVGFILYCINRISEYARNKNKSGYGEHERQLHSIQEAYLNQLFKTKLALDEDDVHSIIAKFTEHKKWDWAPVSSWPVAPLLNQVERQFKGTEIPERILSSLKTLKEKIQQMNNAYYEKEKLKLSEKIDYLIFQTQHKDEVKPTLFLGKDDFSAHANASIQNLADAEKKIWYLLIAKAQKATGSKPSAKYLTETKSLMKELGADKFKKMINDWFNFLINLKEKTTEYTSTYQNQTYTYYNSEFLSSVNSDAIKGLIWICSHFHDSTTLQSLARLAERSYKKIPGKGPAAAAIGNACLYTLYKSKGLDGVGHLSRLRLRIKQSNTQQAITRYIEAAATEQGVTPHEIEDLSVDSYGLEEGARNYLFDDYTCTLKITGVGKSELQWFKPDGTQQKSVPAFVKDKHKVKLKKVKDTQKQVDQTTSAQRDRLDRMFRADRKWNFDSFRTHYLAHGLMSFLTDKIIWTFTQAGATTSAILLNKVWVTNENQVISPNESCIVSLWHPATQSTEEVRKWRSFLVDHKIQQPLKQAFREVYLLTDAEANTRTYSNRMAAHVLKQHQFNMLAKTRGWRYSLLGAYDDGRYNEAAAITIPEFSLKAEFWVNELNADDAFNDTGIWNYITTDQIRFIDTSTDQVLNMPDVPPLPFSEVLRDVDLFVGVASVGNDPTWQDSGGVPAYRDYWTSYSFGDLSEVAKNRKEILTGLVPRLKIGKVSEIKDRFLVVKGKLRTYKIHLGSTNILMEPNDQYLCIVPDRSQKNLTENLFIPFEGDAGLSIILSKAFLLAEDDKITDATITSQINR